MQSTEVDLKIKLFSDAPWTNPHNLLSMGADLIQQLEWLDKPAQHAFILYRMGISSILMGKLKEAFHLFSEACQLHNAINDTDGSLRNQFTIGIVFRYAQQRELAIDTFISAKAKATEVGNFPIEILALCQLVNVLCEIEQLTDAQRYIFEATHTADLQAASDHPAIHSSLGQIAIKEGQLEKAEKELLKAARLSEESTFAFEHQNSLGEYYIHSKQYSKALEQLETTLADCAAKGFVFGELQTRYLLGKLHEENGEIQRAVQYWESCISLSENLSAKEYRNLSMEKLSSYYRDNGLLNKALNLLESLRKEEHLSRKEWQHLNLIFRNDAIHQRENEWEQIISNYEQAVQELEIIKEIGHEITSNLEFDKIFFILHDMLSKRIAMDSLLIHFYNQDTGELVLKYAKESQNQKERVSEKLINPPFLKELLIEKNNDLIINSSNDWPDSYQAESSGYKDEYLAHSIISVRLMIQNKIFGLMTVQSAKQDSYKENHLKMMQAIANFVAIALMNANEHQIISEKNKKIAYMATHDSLTGLPNRTKILNFLEYQIERYQRYNESLVLLFIDIDSFKEINDTQGHQGGDAILKEVADCLSKNIRVTDAVGRLAGDEFLVVLTDNCNRDNGLLIARKILDKLDMRVMLNKQSVPITCSIGLALFPEDGNTLEDIIHAADKAMYASKALGRNRITVFSS